LESGLGFIKAWERVLFSNPLMSLVDILSDRIEAYDHERRPMPIVSGVDVETFI
jgi:hypothetical protein